MTLNPGLFMEIYAFCVPGNNACSTKCVVSKWRKNDKQMDFPADFHFWEAVLDSAVVLCCCRTCCFAGLLAVFPPSLPVLDATEAEPLVPGGDDCAE